MGQKNPASSHFADRHSVGRYNVSGRRRGGAVISVLDADRPGDDGLFGLRQLKAVGYEGANGDGSLDTVGFDVEVLDEDTLRLRIVNIGPPVDKNQQYVDASKAGGNATIEVFEVKRGSNEMRHLTTIMSDAIQTPNKPAASGDGGFLVTNDMSGKLGLRKGFDLLLGGGSLAYCSAAGKCHLAAEKGFAYPNGIVRGHDGLFYVPNSFSNKIKVLDLLPDLTLKETGTIPIGMPIDNLNVDANGDIWGAGMPKASKTFASFADPFNVDAPSTIWRIRKRRDGLGHEVEKMLEDRDATFLGTATVAAHDVKTGRLFIGGGFAGWCLVLRYSRLTSFQGQCHLTSLYAIDRAGRRVVFSVFTSESMEMMISEGREMMMVCFTKHRKYLKNSKYIDMGFIVPQNRIIREKKTLTSAQRPLFQFKATGQGKEVPVPSFRLLALLLTRDVIPLYAAPMYSSVLAYHPQMHRSAIEHLPSSYEQFAPPTTNIVSQARELSLSLTTFKHSLSDAR